MASPNLNVFAQTNEKISGSLGCVYTRRGLQRVARVMVRVPLLLLQSPSAFKIKKKEKKRKICANTEQKLYAAMFFAWLSPPPFPFKGICHFLSVTLQANGKYGPSLRFKARVVKH